MEGGGVAPASSVSWAHTTARHTRAQVALHAARGDCWVVVRGAVYDVSPLVDPLGPRAHPGGADAVFAAAGGDATAVFERAHGRGRDADALLATLVCVGRLEQDREGATQQQQQQHPQEEEEKEEERARARAPPPLSQMLNAFDFEAAAHAALSPAGWAYYSSGADDEFTLRENRTAFQRLWLRPRVLVDVSRVEVSSRILGFRTSFPVYISPTALARFAHPEGEVVLTRACASLGVVQVCPTLASCTLEEMMSARAPGQVQFFQLYVNPDRAATRALVERAERGGARALVVTVDAPVLGRREKDMRHKMPRSAGTAVQAEAGQTVDREQGTARALSTFIDPSLSWRDVRWLRSITSLPIVLKGIQCSEDAVLAARAGAAAVVVSNHGGRQLDTARPAIEILPEVVSALRRRRLLRRTEVWVDGGVRRGSDVFKALALGATAVGVGRPTLYALSSHGQAGVERFLSLLREDLCMTMALCGTRSIRDITSAAVVARAPPAPDDALARQTYVPIALANL